MKVEFKWNDTVQNIAWKKSGGSGGRLFLANEARRLMDPYVPADNLVLAGLVDTHVEGKKGIIEYLAPYAHYQYEGELYVSSKTGSPWASAGEFKVPTGRPLNHSKFRHPLATDHWDQAMLRARKGDLEKAMQKYIDGGML